MQDEKDEFESLGQAAKICGVHRQAIYVAIKRGKLKAEKKVITQNGKTLTRWCINKIDLKHYRMNRNISEERVKDNGERIYDVIKGKWSIIHAARFLSKKLGYPIKIHRIYYLLRKGEIQGSKYGISWVLSDEEVEKIYQMERVEGEHAQPVLIV